MARSRMKHRIAAVLTWLMLVSEALQAAPLLIATDELPPYTSRNQADSFLTDLLAAVGEQMGEPLTMTFMPWKRAESSVEDQSVWAAVPYVPTEERKKKFLFSDPLYSKQTKFFYYSASCKPIDIQFEVLKDLRIFRIGAVRGYYYEQMFNDAKLYVEYVNGEVQNFHKLREGRIDLTPAVEPVGWYLIRKEFGAEQAKCFFTLQMPLQTGANYLMMSRNWPDAEQVLVRFNEALRALKANGTYQRIAEQHGIIMPYIALQD